MKASGVAVVFAGVLVVVGGLALLLYEAGDSPSDAASGPAPDKPGPARRVHAAEEPQQDDTPAPMDPRAVAKPVPKEGRLRFEFEGHPDLALRDWSEVAASFREMTDLFVGMSEQGPPKPEDQAQMEHVRKVSQRFQRAAFERPAGSQGMGKITLIEHPAYAVNLIAATLDRAKLPLTDAQARRLVDLAKERGPRYDEAAAAAETPDPALWTLELASAPAGVLESFYGEVQGTLTPAQSAALVPDVLKNRLRTDFLSAGASWGRVAQQMPYGSQEEIVDKITTGLGNQYGLLERKEELRAIVEAWVKTAPEETADAMDRRGFVRTQVVARAVPRMVELLKRIVDVMKLPDEAAAEARQTPRAYVPMKR